MVETEFGSFTIQQFFYLSAILTFVYVVLLQFTGGAYYSKIQDIREECKAALYSFMADEVVVLEQLAIARAWVIIDKSDEIPCAHLCGSSPNEVQMNLFAAVTGRFFAFDMFGMLKTAIKQNGFFHIEGQKLRIYTEDKSVIFISKYRRRFNDNRAFYPLLKDCHEEILSLEDVIQVYTKIIETAKTLKEREKREIKAVVRFKHIEKFTSFIGRKK